MYIHNTVEWPLSASLYIHLLLICVHGYYGSSVGGGLSDFYHFTLLIIDVTLLAGHLVCVGMLCIELSTYYTLV